MNVLDVEIFDAGYGKNEIIIKEIFFSIQSGELVGLIGPNGAGKSTTIKATLGTLDHINGSVQFGDEKMRYSYIPEQPVFYEELTLWEHIQFTASICELDETTLNNRVKPLLEMFRLDQVIHQLPSTFSKGMQQKLMIVLAFLTQPQLYIIDEPFIGLDPKAMNDFLKLLEKEQEQGAAVLMSTHMLDTAERICDRFILLSGGQIIAQGTLEDIRETAQLESANLFDSFEVLMERSL
ncbi:ABC transporter ATP-binding protein [Filobacillus milosensis]|uniref:ABC transporter ATP-binding protein n=1 Tax=Filobacillus milosensis TaxID=94137 RepID=A0A4Y8IR43_9BACI|nr:ABC transporter ATP-binding protein [Filobacillus milosensis]TFB22934.1 ABC transporter ATP-binding protein [Filobacillus milosensis]